MSDLDLYVYRARLAIPPHGGDPVYDGDTWWLWVDKGFDHWFRSNFRSKLIDSPERNYGSDYEKQKGLEAKAAAEAWFGSDDFYIRTFKASGSHHVDERGRYRWLAEPFRIVDGEKRRLCDALYDHDLATFWPTRWREVHDRLQ